MKTWEELEKKFGLCKDEDEKMVNSRLGFSLVMERKLNKLNTNRVLTIEGIGTNKNYFMKELIYHWEDDMIECLVENYKEPEQINSRFELLDIR